MGLGIYEQASLPPSCQTPSPAPFKKVHPWKGLLLISLGARDGNFDFPPDGACQLRETGPKAPEKKTPGKRKQVEFLTKLLK